MPNKSGYSSFVPSTSLKSSSILLLIEHSFEFDFSTTFTSDFFLSTAFAFFEG